MTAPKSLVRRRVAGESSGDGIPPRVARWFREGGLPPWPALLHPELERVGEWWTLWAAEHPGATPPDASWIRWPAR